MTSLLEKPYEILMAEAQAEYNTAMQNRKIRKYTWTKTEPSISPTELVKQYFPKEKGNV